MNMFFLYLLFVKYGCLSFGGGYVLVTLFIHDLVEKYHLLSAEEFADLLAIAQMTPGPIGINTATYTGYMSHGIIGGIVATAGLLTPAIFLIIAAAFYFKKWEKIRVVQGLLYGMRPATLGLIASAVVIFSNIAIFTVPLTWKHLKACFADDPDTAALGIRLIPLAIAAAAALVMAKYPKTNFIYIIAGAALIGALFIR